jgi:lysophospholipase L1-like esterase
MWLEPNSRLLFIGDSVTDCGRTQPVGEGLRGGLGNGYVSVVNAAMEAFVPERNIRVINVGTSGHTIRDLAGRWERDVFVLKPDYVSVLIGINDVWRQFDSPHEKERHVYPDEYERTLRDLAARTTPTVKRLILMTPFFIEPHATDAMRARMDQYGEIVKRVAEGSGAVFVDTQGAFNAVLAHRHSAAIAWDRVHPNATGHMILARAFLTAIGFTWGVSG